MCAARKGDVMERGEGRWMREKRQRSISIIVVVSNLERRNVEREKICSIHGFSRGGSEGNQRERDVFARLHV